MVPWALSMLKSDFFIVFMGTSKTAFVIIKKKKKSSFYFKCAHKETSIKCFLKFPYDEKFNF